MDTTKLRKRRLGTNLKIKKEVELEVKKNEERKKMGLICFTDLTVKESYCLVIKVNAICVQIKA